MLDQSQRAYYGTLIRPPLDRSLVRVKAAWEFGRATRCPIAHLLLPPPPIPLIPLTGKAHHKCSSLNSRLFQAVRS